MNHDLLNRAISTHKPIICSTGMSREAEIIESKGLTQLDAAYQLEASTTSARNYPDTKHNYDLRKRNPKSGINKEVWSKGHRKSYY